MSLVHSENRTGLKLVDLTVAVGNHTLLEHFNLSLAPDRSIALLAPSGFGKTTLLRTIATLIPPRAGKIFLNDRSPEDIGIPEYRRHVMWVSQNPIMFEKTVRENLQLAFSYHTSRTAYDELTATTLLQSMNLDPKRLNQSARSLSVGEQQRVALARALLLKPQVLLLDEPTSALDTDTIALVETVLKTTAVKNNTSLLIVTHNREQASRLCDTVLNLREGTYGFI